MRKKCLFIILLIIPGFVSAQVESENSILMSGGNEVDRTIKNLAFPLEKTQATHVGAVQSGKLLFLPGVQHIGGDSIAPILKVEIDTFVAGTTLRFISDWVNQGTVYVQCPDQSFKPIMYKGDLLDSAEIILHQAVQLVYTGYSFEMVSEPYHPCPTGFVAVNSNYCIEQNERDSLTFFQATAVCGNLNAKLCTWGEWYAACQQLGAGLNNTSGNYEWIDSAGNFSAPNVQAKVAGGANCQDSWSHTTTNNRAFRCCYNR
ncbi:MAG: hypothetical protein ACHQF2_02780 [Flavobacteriales bacterium]